MVILIASDKTRVRRGLADRLRETTCHRVLAAASVAEMEALPGREGALDLLVFSPVFSESGKEARARLRTRFPGLRTLVLDDRTPLEQSVAMLMQWVGADPGAGDYENEAAAETAAEGTAPAPDRPVEEDRCGWHPAETAGAPADTEPPGLNEKDPSGGEAIPVGGEARGGPVPLSLGDYELQELMESTGTTLIYQALQLSVRRTVVLECLRPELCADPMAAKNFRRMVRARALVSHPVIAAVYEARETGDILFCAYELIPGKSLPVLAAEGRHFPQQVLLSLLRAAAEAMGWMEDHGIPHLPVRPEHLFLGPGHTPRMQNLASCPEEESAGFMTETMARLASTCQRLSEPRSARTRELAHVAGLMRSPGPHGIQTWKALAREARNALHRLADAHTDHAAAGFGSITQVERRWLKRFLGWTAAAAALLAGMAWGVMEWRRSSRAKVRNLDGWVKIPAGPFLFRDGKPVDLAEFWIGRYEVTLAQYADFLESLPQGVPTRCDHVDQPPGKTSHEPPDWSRILKEARRAGSWQGHPLTLNSPVFNVDWWDAWAYTQWRGVRLPTEQEWEKAGREPDGRAWPWGNEPNPKRANTGGNAAAPAGVDGHAWWCDVDAMPEDRSASGVVGLAGNVAEWTSTLLPDPDVPDVEMPVYRGGDFHQTSPVPLNAGPWLAKMPLHAKPFIGFRTASSKEMP
ncbi:MAG: c-type lectin fold [Verrucomicrobiales bacterium]|nr:c-type lectin fold [Verrucomicrobiales bacterium]